MIDAPPKPIWEKELIETNDQSVYWLWHGLLARGNVTLLTGLWKLGKTTLLSLLLSRRKQGGILAGQAVKPGKTVIVSEEAAGLWADRVRRGDFGGQVCFFPQPFLGFPRPEQWRNLLASVAQLQDSHGVDLLVLDPLAPLIPCENNARSMLETLLPLAQLTRRGMAILGIHHPSKRNALLGQAARGSGALLGHVDISVELRRPGGDPQTRRRRLLALSRHTETPRQLLIELNAEATDYLVIEEQDKEDTFLANWDALRLALADAPQKLTRDDILDEWPEDFEKPSLAGLRKWLERALNLGLILVEGTGRKADRFRYWLPEREAVWKENWLYEYVEKQERELNLPFVSLRDKRRRGMADAIGDQRRGDAPRGDGRPEESDGADA